MVNEACLEEYAALIVKEGIQLHQGEQVLINSDVSIWPMAERVSRMCYQNGASRVVIHWSSSREEAMDYAYGDLEKLTRVDDSLIAMYQEQSEQLPCLIHLLTSDPQQFNEKVQAEVRNAKMEKLMPYILKMRGNYRWTAVCIPSESWAEQVFPEEADRLDHLWKDVLSALMINGDGSSIERWQEKFRSMWKHMDSLNGLDLRSLHLHSELGTDLTVSLHEKAMFACASGPEDGMAVNLPSEELFTSPIAGKAEGTLVASCPLVYENTLIENLKLQVQNGKVSGVHASRGEDFMKHLVQTDEGASMLGEVAIVDRHSPIRALGHLLYHTLFDENAACHVAIGRGFPFVLKDYRNMTSEQIHACGINESAIHCDIMWGTDEAGIDGTDRNGNVIAIMKHGEWQL